MKTKIKFFIIGLFLIGLGMTTVNAQSVTSSAATSTATIVIPISITKETNLSFGNIAPSSTSVGTVELTPAASPTRTPTGATLPATTGTISAASFKVDGVAGYTFALQLPGTITLLSGTDQMTIDSWKTSFAAGSQLIGTLTGGTNTFFVGGTLHMIANQPSGNYSNSTDLKITVNYN